MAATNSDERARTVKKELAVKGEESEIKKEESPIKRESFYVVDPWLVDIALRGLKADS